jgi:hypothetical protein
MCKFFVILFITISVSLANLNPSEIENLLPKDSIVRATFVQTKEMKSFDKPLISTGKILAVREKGVIWLTETPQKMKKNIPLIEEEMSKSEQAMISPFFTGDYSALEKRFLLELTKDETSWLLAISPKSNALKRRLKSITIKSSNCNKYQEVIILSADGNPLKINFVNEIPTTQILTADEEKLFEK